MQRAHHLSNVRTALDFLTEKRKVGVQLNPNLCAFTDQIGEY